jgi:hypothetical protein
VVHKKVHDKYVSRCDIAQTVVHGAAVRQSRVRFSAQHPSGSPLLSGQQKKIEWSSANATEESIE